MKKLIKILTVAGIFIYSLTLGSLAFANSIYDQNTQTTFTNVSFGTPNAVWAFKSNFSDSNAVSSLKFRFKFIWDTTGCTNVHQGDNFTFNLRVDDSTNTYEAVVAESAVIGGSVQDLTINESSLVDTGYHFADTFTKLNGLKIYYHTVSTDLTGCTHSGGGDFIGSVYGTTYDNGYTELINNSGTLYPAYAINGGFVGNNSVSFQTPQMADGFSSSDFQYWDTCQNIVSGGSSTSGSAGYNVTAHYGTSTTSMTSTDSFLDSIGYAPIYSLPVSECTTIQKKATSTPGTYYAYLTLDKHSAFTGDIGIATSTIIKFEITAGTSVFTPGTLNLSSVCSTADIVDPVKKAFGCKIPFVYIYQMADIFSSLAATTTDATFTELSLTFPAITVLKNATFTIPFFSKTEILQILPQTTWDFMKALEGAGVVIAFGFLFFHRISGFWHPSDNHHDT